MPQVQRKLCYFPCPCTFLNNRFRPHDVVWLLTSFNLFYILDPFIIFSFRLLTTKYLTSCLSHLNSFACRENQSMPVLHSEIIECPHLRSTQSTPGFLRTFLTDPRFRNSNDWRTLDFRRLIIVWQQRVYNDTVNFEYYTNDIAFITAFITAFINQES